MTLLLGFVAIASALGLFAFALLGRSTVPAATAPTAITPAGASPPRTARDDAELPALHRRMAALARALAPADYAVRVQHRLDLAGNPRSWGPDRLLALKGFGVVGGALLGLLFGAKSGGATVVLAPVLVGVFGLFLPDILVRNLGEKRQIELARALPDGMDTLTVCVEAGLGFDAALGRVARNRSGPMAHECARLLQEMQFGLSRADAMRAMVARTDVAELRSFVSAVIQSSELGVSIGDVLREQSRQMRIKRRQRAEEKAQKLQVKLLMPLISCLLPAMFVVVLGPAVIQLVGFFGKVNG